MSVFDAFTFSPGVVFGSSLAGAAFFVVYRFGVTGIKSLGQPSIPRPDRHVIGWYTLALVAAVIVLAALIAFFQTGKDAPASNAQTGTLTAPPLPPVNAKAGQAALPPPPGPTAPGRLSAASGASR